MGVGEGGVSGAVVETLFNGRIMCVILANALKKETERERERDANRP